MQNKKKSKPQRPADPGALLRRGAIAILVLAALAIGLNLLQQALFSEPAATPTPASWVSIAEATSRLVIG
jgi:hypothetical protein